jgi:hypothetical protein
MLEDNRGCKRTGEDAGGIIWDKRGFLREKYKRPQK